MRILIIHFDPVYSRELKESLEFLNYSSDTVNDSGTWKELFQKQAYEIIITCHQSPGFDSLEILREAKSFFPKVQVIILEPALGVDFAVRAINSRVFAIFDKPLETRDLLVCFKQIEDEINPEKEREEKHARLAIEYGKLKQAYDDLLSASTGKKNSGNGS